jgi:hypothetical protein
LAHRLTKLLHEYGIPPQLRGRIWSAALGNPLKISRELYDGLSSAGQSGVQYEEKAKRLALLATDLPRTFPALGNMFSAETSPYAKALTTLLQAYARFRPELGDIGYVQGMSYLGAMVLMHGDVDGMCQDLFPAFVTLANLIDGTVLLPLLRMEPATTERYFQFFLHHFQALLPELSAHFDNIGLHPSVFLVDWSYTLFCKSLPADVALWIWDRVLVHPDGDVYVLKAAYGLLQILQPALLLEELEGCIKYLRNMQTMLQELHADAGLGLFHTIDEVKLSMRHWQAFRSALDQRAEPGGRQQSAAAGWRTKLGEALGGLSSHAGATADV